MLRFSPLLHFVQKLASNDDFDIVFRQVENLEAHIFKISVSICLSKHCPYLLCKSQGAEPSILRFLFIFFVRPSFLPCEDKNPPSAISCSFISKLVTVLPFQSKNRTLLSATDQF